MGRKKSVHFVEHDEGAQRAAAGERAHPREQLFDQHAEDERALFVVEGCEVVLGDSRNKRRRCVPDEGEREVREVPLHVQHQYRNARLERLFDEDHEQACLSRVGHPEDGAVGDEVLRRQEEQRRWRRVRQRASRADRRDRACRIRASVSTEQRPMSSTPSQTRPLGQHCVAEHERKIQIPRLSMPMRPTG